MKKIDISAVISAEECRDTGDCTHVTCPENDYNLECHNRQCTCTHSEDFFKNSKLKFYTVFKMSSFFKKIQFRCD